ncbi:hypothetical protein A3461_05930 [Enterobacter roggenkampii]|nr:hypothetical protein A3461_05930 [Enterobacter roggenkampii]
MLANMLNVMVFYPFLREVRLLNSTLMLHMVIHQYVKYMVKLYQLGQRKDYVINGCIAIKKVCAQ